MLEEVFIWNRLEFAGTSAKCEEVCEMVSDGIEVGGGGDDLHARRRKKKEGFGEGGIY